MIQIQTSKTGGRRRFPTDKDILKGRAGPCFGASRVGHAPGEIGLDLGSVGCVGKGKTGTTGGLGTFQTVFTNLVGDIDVAFGVEKTLLFDFLTFFFVLCATVLQTYKDYGICR